MTKLPYRVICISLYHEDIAQLDEMVIKLKAQGMTRANRSALIRYALNEIDLDKARREQLAGALR